MVAATEHPVFFAPENENARIWRYMDFTKFVAMLQSGGLYFARADRLGDHFEGTLTRATRREWEALAKAHELPADVPEMILGTSKMFRRRTFVNCWHLGEHESAAMWKLYASSTEAIAVQSTFARLTCVLPKKAHTGLVHYVDFDSFAIPTNNSMWPFVFKRKSYEHEREVRALFQQFPGKDENFDIRSEPKAVGEVIKVPLSDLVERVVVSPGSPEWYFDLVEGVSSRFGYDFDLCRSRLEDDPLL